MTPFLLRASLRTAASRAAGGRRAVFQARAMSVTACRPSDTLQVVN